MTPFPAVVAIDGPAGAGKSTVSRRVAAQLGYTYIDTGAMYRCVALAALNSNRDDIEAIAREIRVAFGPQQQVYLNGADVTSAIREPRVSEAASKVSANPEVRKAMVKEQRRIAEGTSVVMEGRDIGTVVFPDAQVKIFLDADPLVRARRRAEELNAKGIDANVDEIAQQIRDRDHRDATRADSPMVAAPDAIRVDTSGLSLEQVEEAILDIVRKRKGSSS
jgi:cytidylate kinase